MNARILGILLLASFLGGCFAVGPDYARPKFDSPVQWTEGAAVAGNADGFEQIAWWKAFKDPVLNELITRAVKSNLDLRQAQARVVQARSDLGVAGAALLPTVNVTGSTQSTYTNSVATSAASFTSSTPVYPSTIYQAGFDSSWEIDVFGGLRRQRESSSAKLDASVEDLRSTILTLLGDVAKYYVTLRASQEQLRIAKDAVRTQEDNVVVTRERYRAGLISHLDVSQAEAQKSTTESDIPTLESTIKQSIHRLGILLGQEPNAVKDILSDPRPLPDPGAVYCTGLPSQLLSRRPDLRKLERDLASTSADIGTATADYYPKFDLTLGLGVQGNVLTKYAGLTNWYWSIVPGFSLPAFNAGKTRSLVEKKRALYDEALAKYHAAFNSALEDVENALAAFMAEQRRKTILAESVRANEDALALANEQYRRGLTTFLDVLTAEKSLYTAQNTLCQSNANLLTSLVSLYKALGGGWEIAGTELPLAIHEKILIKPLAARGGLG